MVVHRDARFLREDLRFSPVGGDAVDVTQQIHDHPTAVWGDIQREPGPLLHDKIDFTGLSAGEGDIPLLLLLSLEGGGWQDRRGQERKAEQGESEDGQDPMTLGPHVAAPSRVVGVKGAIFGSPGRGATKTNGGWSM
jgi:hypothetical protein